MTLETVEKNCIDLYSKFSTVDRYYRDNKLFLVEKSRAQLINCLCLIVWISPISHFIILKSLIVFFFPDTWLECRLCKWMISHCAIIHHDHGLTSLNHYLLLIIIFATVVGYPPVTCQCPAFGQNFVLCSFVQLKAFSFTDFL